MGDVNQKNTWMVCGIALPSLAWLIHFRDEDSDRKTPHAPPPRSSGHSFRPAACSAMSLASHRR